MKILIAEDDAITRPQMEGLLTTWGHDVVACADGLQAWAAVQQDDAPRLLVLDRTMPGMDGIELCRRIRTLTNAGQYYILFLTVKGGDEEIAEGMEAGADAYMTKPFAREGLQAQIHTGVQPVHLYVERRAG